MFEIGIPLPVQTFRIILFTILAIVSELDRAIICYTPFSLAGSKVTAVSAGCGFLMKFEW